MIFRMFHWKSSVVSGAELCRPEYRKRLRNTTVPSLVFIFIYMVRAIFRLVLVGPHGNGDPSYGLISGTKAGDCSFEATQTAWKKPPPKIYSGPDMPAAPVSEGCLSESTGRTFRPSELSPRFVGELSGSNPRSLIRGGCQKEPLFELSSGTDSQFLHHRPHRSRKVHAGRPAA